MSNHEAEFLMLFRLLRAERKGDMSSWIYLVQEAKSSAEKTLVISTVAKLSEEQSRCSSEGEAERQNSADNG